MKNLEINVEQLKAVETRLREEKGDAVREKNRLALKVKYVMVLTLQQVRQFRLVKQLVLSLPSLSVSLVHSLL